MEIEPTMLSFLDPKVWVACVLIAISAYVYGRHDGTSLTEAKWVEKSAQAERLAGAKYVSVTKKVNEVSAKLEEEKENAFKIATQRDAAIRSGAMRLYVPIRPSPDFVGPPAPGEHKETRAELDPAFAIRLIGYTDEGDSAIRELNSCIDAYNGVREKYGSNSP